jgi:hypothetical protein
MRVALKIIVVQARGSRMMKKLIGLLVVLVALMGLTVTELVWGGSEADAESAEVNKATDTPSSEAPARTRRGKRNRRR